MPNSIIIFDLFIWIRSNSSSSLCRFNLFLFRFSQNSSWPVANAIHSINSDHEKSIGAFSHLINVCAAQFRNFVHLHNLYSLSHTHTQLSQLRHNTNDALKSLHERNAKKKSISVILEPAPTRRKKNYCCCRTLKRNSYISKDTRRAKCKRT